MPKTRVLYFKEADGTVPVLDWLKELRQTNRKAFAKCAVTIERLEACGHELRRPEADLLRDGIYELRTRQGRVQYRILYFFHGRQAAVLAHALTKERVLPGADIERALERMQRFVANPDTHSYAPE